MKVLKSISAYHTLRALPSPSHPLISVIDYGASSYPDELYGEQLSLPYYSIGLKRDVGTVRYGQQEYDFDNGVMSFIAPGQLITIQKNQKSERPPSGWLLLIHPDFLWGSALSQAIRSHEFFSYDISEALFLSEREEQMIERIIIAIRDEIDSTIDAHSQSIVHTQIELLLQYAERYYARQFITRQKSNHQILQQLNTLIDQSILDQHELPTVTQLAAGLHLSPGYLSSLLRSLTGLNTQQHIHERLIAIAKEKLSSEPSSISEIAYSLGFEHPQSFTKLFKNKTQLSPSAFRRSLN